MTEDAQMKLRLPKALKQQIEAAALENNRSLTGEIVSRLEDSFPNYEPEVVQARRGPRHETIEVRLQVLENKVQDIISALIAEPHEKTISSSLKLLKNMKKNI